jgi:hypothetical protein
MPKVQEPENEVKENKAIIKECPQSPDRCLKRYVSRMPRVIQIAKVPYESSCHVDIVEILKKLILIIYSLISNPLKLNHVFISCPTIFLINS